MKNKVMIKVIVPQIDSSFDIFIPVNEVVWRVKKLIIKSVSDLTGGALNFNGEYLLINTLNSRVYGNNEIIINTDIRNATELVLYSISN